MANIEALLNLSRDEKVRRFEEICRATFSHINGRDLLLELHPRKTLDIKRRVDAKETWFEADWLTSLLEARDGRRYSNKCYSGEGVTGASQGTPAAKAKSDHECSYAKLRLDELQRGINAPPSPTEASRAIAWGEYPKVREG